MRCRRYGRALDMTDLSNAFLNLWSLLETLTGIADYEGHDKVVKRASAIYDHKERRTHEQVLHHLRRYRNSYVHASEDSAQGGAYLHQLRIHTEWLLWFHLTNSSHFSSLEEVGRFLNLPSVTEELHHLIDTEKRKVEEAEKTVRLAKKGLQFREGHPGA
jgi:hypothetical protein